MSHPDICHAQPLPGHVPKDIKLKLFYSPASPFVRKTLVLAAENNLTDRIEKIQVATTVVAQDQELSANNPTAKIPALVTKDHGTLYDSRVVCQYLDTLHTNASFYPTDTGQKWNILRLEALCDGILDAAVNAQYEKALRPKELFWDEWFAGQMKKVSGGIKALDNELSILEGPINIVHVAAACALNYVNFRHTSLNWQAAHPKLAAWLETFNQRPSMQQTRPD